MQHNGQGMTLGSLIARPQSRNEARLKVAYLALYVHNTSECCQPDINEVTRPGNMEKTASLGEEDF